jgi:hypothetical protein
MAETLAAFFLMSGMTKEKTSSVLRAIAAATFERELRLESDFSVMGSQLSNAVAAWWRDPTYLNEAGEPADLPEKGPAPSVDALLESHVDSHLRVQAKELLRRTTAQVEDGKWRMEENRGFLRVSDHEAVQQLHLQWSGLLSTFFENQVRRREPAKLKNFDSMAYAQDFPVSMIPALRAKIAKRFPVVMHDIDALLTSGAASDQDGPVATVAVTVFMQTSQPRSRGEGLHGKAQWRAD